MEGIVKKFARAALDVDRIKAACVWFRRIKHTDIGVELYVAIDIFGS